MKKIAIHTSFGGFRLTKEAISYLKKLGVNLKNDYDYDKLPRDDKNLIITIEDLKEDASDDGDIRIIEIPDDVDWFIEDYDGAEWVSEVHQTWRYEEEKIY